MTTTKLLGDEGEHYALAYLSFYGGICSKMPDNWPAYDLFLQKDNEKFCVSVKTRSETGSFSLSSHFKFDAVEMYEWLVFIVKYKSCQIESWVVPVDVAISHSSCNISEKGGTLCNVYRLKFSQLKSELNRFKDNWSLSIRQ